ncbi:hypothetical protein N8I77_000931 [Diaporthe amygdali]|uniref:Uncharacterized protein n=1 Tax=Phomopsis amygdali TaxID=1214568 RepID=A0AAD9W8X7_PHOAM|nr:hypothetical protein N8I77_000931 [Diaporthe amygdali]
MKNSKILPLRGLNLYSKPLNHRAIAWSCDAELAVAADDSLFVFLPEFPLLDPNDEDEDDDEPMAEDDPPDMQVQDGFLSSRLPKKYGEGDDDDEDRLEEDSEDDDIEAPTASQANGGVKPEGGDDTHQAATRANIDPLDTSDPRRQFFDGMRHFPVSWPYLSAELNAHIWEAAGRQMPLLHTNVRDHLDRDVTHILDAMPKDAEQEAEYLESGTIIPFHEVNHHPGAGVGMIGSAGTSMNHVVAVEWSPSGMGRNRRPVLAVLTGCGSLAVYGEGCALPFGSTARPLRSVATKGKGAVRDLASWVVMWAVGENFVVPGQEEYGYGEFIKAFSWSQEIGPGKALLGYVNDLREMVILSVVTEYRKTEDGLEEAIWNVQEVCRFETETPHGQQDLNDPDYVPAGSSYCVRWSPWIQANATWTCVISYMERNYVGFRRITIDVSTWKPREVPKIMVDPNDWDGRCIHLGTDAFLEFENTVWTVSNMKLCRGFIATPLVAEPFEVDLARSNPNRPKPEHSTELCNTSLLNHDLITNPITGLVVHPVSPQTVSPPPVSFYTAVRLSATATNPSWWESNFTKPGDHEDEPQWVAEIQQKICSMLPQGLAGRVGIFGDDGEDGEDGIEPDDGAGGAYAADAGPDDDDDEAGSEESSDDETGTANGYAGPDVHPHRMRIWGLAISPGGGSTAVLATSQLTQKPERGGWHSHRSRVMFGYTEHGAPRRQKHQQHQQQQQQQRAPQEEELLDPSLGGTGPAEGSAVNVDNLTTEARLWEWMYGGGSGVPGITHYSYTAEKEAAAAADGTVSPGRAAQEARDALAQARRDRVREIFRPFAEGQTCSICDDGRTKFVPIQAEVDQQQQRQGQNGSGDGAVGGQLDCACENGHRVAVCGASGLAIGEPGISRCCGVCRSRCINIDVLVEQVLLPVGKAQEAEIVRREITGDVCVRCGGKYLD